MSLVLPPFEYPCLSPGATALTLYLISMPDAFNLHVYEVNLADINAPVAKIVTHMANKDWQPSTFRDCNNFPYDTDKNSPVMIQMFEPNSQVVPIYPNKTGGVVWSYNETKYITPKAYSVVGAVGNQIAILAWAKIKLGTVVLQQWVLNRQTPTIDSILWDVPNISPTPPMISAGAYYSNSTSGSLVVFDQQSNGIIYQTSTYPVNATAGSPFTLQWNITSRQEVDSGGIVLTPNAVSVDAENVAYIFDQTADNMTAVYAVRPGVSNKLEKISGSGPAPVFSKYMAAMTWKGTGGLLATYYKNITTGIAYFNLFNTTSGKWTGQELVLPPPATTSAKPSGQNTPFPSNGSGDKDMPSLIGGVAGGIVGLLVILAIVGYVFIRRGQSQQSGGRLGVFGREMDKKTTGNGSASDASVNLTVVADPTRLSTVQGINNIKVAMHGYTGDNIKNAYFTESNRGSPHTLNTDGLYLANDVSSTKTSLPDTSATPSPPTANVAFNRALDPLEEQYRLEWRNSTPQSPHAVIQNTQGDLWNQHS